MKKEVFYRFIIFNNGLIIFLLINMFSCKNDDIQRNPFLHEVSFSHSINLNLPEYNNLNFAGGSIYLPYGGINGIIVFNLNGNDIFAWEASCSNHKLDSCSKLSIEGLIANCGCHDFKYSLATGQLLEGETNNNLQYPLLNYRSEKYGKTIIISN